MILFPIFLAVIPSLLISQEVYISMDCPTEVGTHTGDNHITVNMTSDVVMDWCMISLTVSPENHLELDDIQWIPGEYMYTIPPYYVDDHWYFGFWGGAGVGYVLGPQNGPILDLTFYAGEESGTAVLEIQPDSECLLGNTEYSLNYDDGYSIYLTDCNEGLLSFGSQNLHSSTLAIEILNTEPISYFEFDIDGLQITAIESGLIWVYDFIIVMNDQGHVAGWTTQDNPIPPTEGLLCNLVLENQQEIALGFSHLAFADPDGNPLCIAAGDSTWLVIPPDVLIGDANQDGLLNVLDIVQIINFILSQSDPGVFEQYVYDVNTDGTVDVVDLVMLVQLILTYE